MQSFNFPPDDHSRVHLTPVEGVPDSDYINASFINVSCDLKGKSPTAALRPAVLGPTRSMGPLRGVTCAWERVVKRLPPTLTSPQLHQSNKLHQVLIS